jgi:hypothetical protein
VVVAAMARGMAVVRAVSVLVSVSVAVLVAVAFVRAVAVALSVVVAVVVVVRRWQGSTVHIFLIKKLIFWMLADMQKSIQPGKLTYVGNWYYYFGQRKLLKPPTMAL